MTNNLGITPLVDEQLEAVRNTVVHETASRANDLKNKYDAGAISLEQFQDGMREIQKWADDQIKAVTKLPSFDGGVIGGEWT